ncbi:hypothetical protein WJX81_000262 [Elliptochloris bilobata]|uniref:AAA+ ATPase domain-containing protein n=1 Tax=Elliptochloris bilobata TaxID=381761 RepID=A0AAW1SG05_9CHLO
MQAELLELADLLPHALRTALLLHEDFLEVLEVVMDVGRPPLARFPAGDVRLSEQRITYEDLDLAVAKLGDFGGDNRAGIDRTLHRISCLRNRDGRVIGLTCRAGRAVCGSAALAADLVADGRSLLLLGRPGVGKTTSVREIARLLSEEHRRRVVIIDTSNEIGGDGDIPHPGIGCARRMQVAEVEHQHRTMIEAVENHMPEALVIDEIGNEAEALAARSISQRGIQLIATAHGGDLATLVRNPALAELVGGIQSVTLGDEEARRRGGGRKSVLERAQPPTFDVAVELLGRRKWRVHADLAAAVDRLLADGDARGQLVTLDAEGAVVSVSEREAEAGEASPMATAADAWGRGPHEDPSWQDPAWQDAAWGAAAGGPAESAPAAQPGGSSAAWPAAFNGQEEDAAPEGAVRIYTFGLDDGRCRQVLAALGLSNAVALTRQMHECDAVMALRERLRAPGAEWVRDSARATGVPIFSLRTTSDATLVKALRTLAGVDPSALTLGDPAAAAGADPGGGRRRPAALRAQDDVARLGSGAGAGSYVSQARAGDRGAALEEARLAVERLVLPGGEAAELLPRAPGVLLCQEELVRSYGLTSETVGGGASARLRILPPHGTADASARIGREWSGAPWRSVGGGVAAGG